MMYYILYPGNDEKDTVNDINQLGESSFNTFWAYKGFELLMIWVIKKLNKLKFVFCPKT